MDWTAGARWLIALASGRARRRAGRDPADMGTAFGLDATTTLEPQTVSEVAFLESRAAASRLDRRVHRRSRR